MRLSESHGPILPNKLKGIDRSISFMNSSQILMSSFSSLALKNPSPIVLKKANAPACCTSRRLVPGVVSGDGLILSQILYHKNSNSRRRRESISALFPASANIFTSFLSPLSLASETCTMSASWRNCMAL